MNPRIFIGFIVWCLSVTVKCSNSNRPYLHKSNVVIINGELYDLGAKDEWHNTSTLDSRTDKSVNIDNQTITDHHSDVFVDLILVAVRRLIKDQGLDPADLPDETAKFSKKIFGIKIWGSARVSNTKTRTS